MKTKIIALIALISAVVTAPAALVLDVRESRGTAAGPGFVIHGNGPGSVRITGGWEWSPTVYSAPVDRATVDEMTLPAGPAVLDLTALDVNEDRFAPAPDSLGYIVGRDPGGDFQQFALWRHNQSDPRTRVDLRGVPIVPEPGAALLCGSAALIALLRRRR